MSKTRDLANLADLNFDSGTMVVDKDNDRVGVGNAAPATALDVTGTVTADDVYVGTSLRHAGDGDTYLYFPSAGNNIGLVTGGSERLRIDNSGNLLVGGTSAAEAGSLTVYPTGIVQARVVGSNAIIADRTSTDGEIIDIRKDGGTVGSIGVSSSRMYIAPPTGYGIKVAGDDIRPVTTAGANSDNTLDLGKSFARFKDLYLSGGVYLGGTGSANKLDDYETGTWTPVFADATSGGNASPTTATNPEYVKIGNLVQASCRLSNVNTSGLTSANDAILRGLPYASNAEIVGSTWLQAVNTSSGTVMVVPRGTSGVSYVRFQEIRDSANDIHLTVGSFLDDLADITLSITYTTDT